MHYLHICELKYWFTDLHGEVVASQSFIQKVLGLNPLVRRGIFHTLKNVYSILSRTKFEV